jgi:plastocyanin
MTRGAELARKSGCDPVGGVRRTRGMRLLPLLFVVLVAGCGSASASKPQTVDIKAFKFAPPTLTVKKGSSVAWVNHDKAGHTATFADLDTDRLEKGDRKSLTFKQAGRYPYVCAFHAFMKGVVVVQ